jgi:hypothetical protein
VKRVHHYQGRVWCLTMPSGFLVTRRARANDKGQVVIASRPVIIGSTLVGPARLLNDVRLPH